MNCRLYAPLTEKVQPLQEQRMRQNEGLACYRVAT